jgi:hypothetical protein
MIVYLQCYAILFYEQTVHAFFLHPCSETESKVMSRKVRNFLVVVLALGIPSFSVTFAGFRPNTQAGGQKTTTQNR